MTPHQQYRVAAGICALIAICGPAWAAPETLVLSPMNMLAQTHSHGLMLNFTSTYRQLSGVLDFDYPARTCHIDVRFDVRSLSAPNALMHAQTMSKSFLDAQDFPESHYVGDCSGNQLVGNLTLRGQTHPFTMTLTYAGTAGEIVSAHAEGVMNRLDWGVDGMQMAVGKTIRVTNDISFNGEPPRPSS